MFFLIVIISFVCGYVNILDGKEMLCPVILILKNNSDIHLNPFHQRNCFLKDIKWCKNDLLGFYREVNQERNLMILARRENLHQSLNHHLPKNLNLKRRAQNHPKRSSLALMGHLPPQKRGGGLPNLRMIPQKLLKRGVGLQRTQMPVPRRAPLKNLL